MEEIGDGVRIGAGNVVRVAKSRMGALLGDAREQPVVYGGLAVVVLLLLVNIVLSARAARRRCRCDKSKADSNSKV